MPSLTARALYDVLVQIKVNEGTVLLTGIRCSSLPHQTRTTGH